MSRAFIKEDSQPEVPVVLHRVPLPPGVPNYVTVRGLRLLQEELSLLQHGLPQASSTEHPESQHERGRLSALALRRAELEQRIASAVVVPVPYPAPSDVRFGARVTVQDSAGKERCYQLVGADEADPARGLIAFFTPLSRALLGRFIGEETHVVTPRGEEVLEIRSVSYTNDAEDGSTR